MSAVSFRMPLQFLRGSYSRLALTLIALACGVGLVCGIDLVNRAALRAFVEVVDNMAGRAALRVSAGGSGLIPEDIATTAAGVPGVELAVPVVSGTAFTTDGSGELLTVHGVDITNDAAVRVYQARDAGGLELEDPLAFLSQPDSVVLSRTFAARRKLSVGDQVTLETPSGQRAFRVRALLEPQGIARVYGGNLLVMDLFAAEAAFTRPGFVNHIDVVIKRDHNVAEVAAALDAVLPAGLKVDTPTQRKADLHKVMQSIQVLLQGFGLIGLIAAFLIAFNRLTTVFESRAWQLGVLRADGVRTRVVWWELLKESLLLGMGGVVLGIPFGTGLAWLALPIVARATSLAYQVVVPDAGLTVQPSSLALACAVGLGAALLAAALPAWRAARMSIVATIGGRGREQPDARRNFPWVLLAICLGGVALTVCLQALTRSAGWGLVATVLIALSTALAARPLVHLCGSSLIVPLGSLLGPSGTFAIAVIAQNRRRSGLTIGMMGVGLGSAVWLWTLAQSFEQSVIDLVNLAYRADLMVTSAHYSSGWSEAPIDERLVSELQGIPGVAAVSGHRIIDWHYRDGAIAIEAYDPAYFTDPGFGVWPLVGPQLPDVWSKVARGEAAVVSSNFLQNLGVEVDTNITLDTPSGPLTIPIAGATVLFASPRGTVEISRELYKRYWHDTKVTRAFVRVTSGSDPRAVSDAVARQLGKRYALRILFSGELAEYWANQVRRAFAALYPLAGMVLLVVLVGVADTLAASVTERTRELGVVRAFGLRRRHLSQMVIVEGALLGTLGLLLAMGSGLALGTLWVDATFPYLLGWVFRLHPAYTQMAFVAFITVAVCLTAAILPARMAAKLEPAQALRYE